MNDPTHQGNVKKHASSKAKLQTLNILSHMSDEKNSTDVLGSYTGMAKNGETPVQDVDDL